MINGLVRQIGQEAKRRAVTHAPVGRQQTIVRRARLAERRTRQPRNDLAPAYREQVLDQREPLMSRLLVARWPIEYRGLEGRGIQRVGNPIAVLRIGSRAS